MAVYAGLDPRMSFLEDLGMVLATSVTELAQGESFFCGLSYENFEQLSSDILISSFETPETDAAFFSNPLVALQPQVQAGVVAPCGGGASSTRGRRPRPCRSRGAFPSISD